MKTPYSLMADQNSIEFAYDMLYDLTKLEEERRAYLDTKAATYIGLLGVSISILTAFGGILTFQNGQVLEIKDKNTIFSNDLLMLIYILYLAIILLFIIAVFFAFRAYNTGSSPLNKNKYVFSWNEIPGNDNKKLTEFLTQEFLIDWAKTARIEKIDNDKTINMSTKENFLSLKLDAKNTEVILEIDDGRTNKFITKMEDGKLNIYKNKSEDPIQKFCCDITNFLEKTLYKIANVPIPKDGKYKWIDQKFIVNNKNSNLEELKSRLVDEINTKIYMINYDLNNKKAIRINKAYISTIFGISILLIEVILIVVLGIGLI